MFVSPLINLAFNLLDRYLISKITFAPLREYVQGRYALLKSVADVLTDKNPNNNEQLQKVWENYDEIELDASLETAARIIEIRMKDKNLAADLALVLRTIKEADILDNQLEALEELKNRPV